MTFSREFCDGRALEAAQAASNAKLDNVRDRELRSEAAWRAMSDRIRSIEEARTAREAARVAGESGSL
ncbi:hypothetical protein GR702_01220 [Novosphingobium sp. FGD1]|uniref:Uncharacterized protein n=1 Tax=Novosphingobium silvae TaxID=2692619 RepID=A0A7X4GDI8_9SPHN|nr:hypothetical protein [Novosphingobium silvae]MYL96395.1 hypothetical protein [Novosphingobium silvae]